MTGIIVTGHGLFASGLKSSVELITGEQENVKYIDFTEELSAEKLEDELRKATVAFGDEGVLFLTDLVGGTPFKTCALISHEHEESGVVCGVNLPMLLETLFIREDFGAAELMRQSKEIGMNGIKTYPDQMMNHGV